MKTLFIPAKSTLQITDLEIKSLSKKLPKNFTIAYSIQYKELAEKIKLNLSKKHKINSFIQVLGCSKPKLPKSTKSVLLISDGKFHATSLAYETKIPVYLFTSGILEKISKKEIEIFSKKQKGAYLKYLHAEKIGILISTKSGQENLKKAIDFQKKIKNKKSYLFISNNIDTNEFENFQIDSWINTSCPRMDMNEGSIINISKI
ncbi:MAG: diphthamide synthesis protein [Nanoarchaeota archaeon]